MATRFKAADLKEMIRSLVRQEMKENLAEMINEVFSERYIKKLVETATTSQPRGVNHLDIMGDETEEEETPSILANNILGVGQENPVFKKVPKEKGVKQFSEDVERNEMLSLFFEGTQPITASENAMPTPGDTDEDYGNEAVAPIPVEKKEVKRMTEVWRTLAGVDKPAVAPVANVAEMEKLQEARLKRLRDQLEVKAN
jgi:hypothetical protein